jgi:hypothetical protein
MTKEDQIDFVKGEQVVQFEKPSEAIVETDDGFEVVKSLGWVKFSAAFRKNMLKKLKGAKLGIFICICLHLNENGEAFPGIDKIAEETGYHRDTIMVEIAEMELIPGLMRVTRERGKPNHYIPAFVARGAGKNPVVGNFLRVGQPAGSPVEEIPTTLEPTSLENPDSKESLRKKEKKNNLDMLALTRKILEGSMSIENAIAAGIPVTEEMRKAAEVRDLAPKSFEAALGFSKPLPWWSNKDWTKFAVWVVEQFIADPRIFEKFETWRATPFIRGSISNQRIRGFVTEFYDAFDMFQKTVKKEEPEYVPPVVDSPYARSLETTPRPRTDEEQAKYEEVRARMRANAAKSKHPA